MNIIISINIIQTNTFFQLITKHQTVSNTHTILTM